MTVEAGRYLGEIRSYLDESKGLDPAFDFKFDYVSALFHFQSGEPDRARKLMSDLIGVDKTFIPAYTALASYYLAQDKNDIAEFIVKRGIDRNKLDEHLANMLGAVYFKSGKIEEAETWFGKALELSPGFAPALINRASLRMKQGKEELAWADISAVKDEADRPSSYYVILGILLERKGQHDASEKAFLAAIQRNPEDSYAKYHLAALYERKQDDRHKAARLYNEVVQISGKQSTLGEMASLQMESLREDFFAK
jgi:tetratricopeptide (TPR) repeat protein